MTLTAQRLSVPLFLLCCFLLARPVVAQDSVTGAFEGYVTQNVTRVPIKDAEVEFRNEQTGIAVSVRTDTNGHFYEGQLAPAVYRIRVVVSNFQTIEFTQELTTGPKTRIDPDPVLLKPSPTATLVIIAGDIRVEMTKTDATLGGDFTKNVTTIPLGSTTLIRSFDELALLLPGVAPPPETIGNVAGPGVGAGVGSSGQFAVNGLRSRANNFTVDGSDNNDEDIGVRRQGFVSLISEPIESIQEYKVTTLLAPAEVGRNIGAQVNAVSKTGTERIHGTVYGFFNASQLNARDFFDSSTNSEFPLRTDNDQPALLDGNPIVLRNQSGGENSFTLVQAGFAFGGPLKQKRIFYFLSGEFQSLNANREESFAVPTLPQRGAFGTGTTGIFRDPFTGDPTAANPTGRNGAAILSLFPFPNNPQGIYGANTFTQVLPAGGQGRVMSARVDGDFDLLKRRQSVTGRYNFTDDRRDIPVTGGAIFSTLRPEIRSQNFSFFWKSTLSEFGAKNEVQNTVRLSYGRTRLRFDEVRDRQFLIPSQDFPETPFLLNARELFNLTLP